MEEDRLVWVHMEVGRLVWLRTEAGTLVSVRKAPDMAHRRQVAESMKLHAQVCKALDKPACMVVDIRVYTDLRRPIG